MIRIGASRFRKLRKFRGLLADGALLVGVLFTIWLVAKVGAGMTVTFRPPTDLPAVSLDPAMLPLYAARSTLRMFLGLGLSILFTLNYGKLAARNRRAEKVLIPLLDILQSIPVLGFLSVTVTFFIALFPGSLLGLEFASIFAIFTGQAWNMTFAFYHSLITLPRELDEAARMFRLTAFQRFWKLEVPASMIPLVWNGMMSFGGGWFFLAASEAITVINQKYTLPGLGSYVALAVGAKNYSALIWAVVTMAIVILLIDQLFWKPLVAWSEKFKMERSAAATHAHSWVYDLLKASRIPKLLTKWLREGWEKLQPIMPRRPQVPWEGRVGTPVLPDNIFSVLLVLVIAFGVVAAALFIHSQVGLAEVGQVFIYGVLSLLRVLLLVALATIVWVPIGVAIGFSPKLSRYMQPVVQFLAAFPANFVFPVATIFFLRAHISLDWGSILLMALGAQWYILFNTIAGAMSVPTDLREMVKSMRLSRFAEWKSLILPAIFPAWVTGAITASGGAWNASIVSEVVEWGNTKLKAQGLGWYISEATVKGDWPREVLGVALMCLFVVGVNRLLWRRLYNLAETRFKLG